MQGKLIASYRRELSALDDLARAAACMLCEIEEERAGMLTRFLYENAVEPAQISAVLHDLCGSKVG